MRSRLPSSAQLRALARRGWGAALRFLRRFRIPVRLRITRGGALFVGGAVAIGLAAINTGSNLLYLLVGAMIGFIAVSGWLSERVIWGVKVDAAFSASTESGVLVRGLPEDPGFVPVPTVLPQFVARK